MPRSPKKKTPEQTLPDAPVRDQPITETIERNYMPYAMSVIVSRAIPEIDGFKPSQRKLLYTMYDMGLMTGPYTKSANIVGATMHLNPHGDATIYETMVRLTRANGALLHPFIDSKGVFGKQYSSEMDYAAPRYTGARLDPFCETIFGGIDRDAVDMVDNYDGTAKEPRLLPTAFPNILVSPNTGIAVGMATSICSFNLAEVCEGAIEMLRNPAVDADRLLDIIKAPDFAGGGQLLYDREKLLEIYKTGKGSVRLRSKYRYDKAANCIEILEIPYSTTIELIIKKITDLVREGKLREISDFRNEVDLSGFKLTVDLRRGVDPDALMAKLFRLTPLEDSFSCNFNVIIDGSPRALGLPDILREWISFRVKTVRRELSFDLSKKQEKLHLLLGLGKILLDIDKAVKIVRDTAAEKEVVPNLMAGFDIDRTQAEYVAEIKLRHLNREYILNRVKEIDELQKEISSLEETLGSERKLKSHIAAQLREIIRKYGVSRRTEIITDYTLPSVEEESAAVENYPVHLIGTREGYFKKITPQSMRAGGEQAVKEGDEVVLRLESENRAELLVFTDRCRCYKVKVADIEPCKSSQLGDFLPARLGFEREERPVFLQVLTDYAGEGHFVFLFESGKGVRVAVSAYETKSARKKLTSAFSDASPVAGIFYEPSPTEPLDLLLVEDDGRGVLLSSGLIPEKATRASAGVQLIKLRKGRHLARAVANPALTLPTGARSPRKTSIPATPVLLPSFDPAAQTTLL